MLNGEADARAPRRQFPLLRSLHARGASAKDHAYAQDADVRGPRSSRPGLQPVHRRVRYTRLEAGQGLTRRTGIMKFRAVSLVVALRCQSVMSAIREGIRLSRPHAGHERTSESARVGCPLLQKSRWQLPPGRSRVRFRAYHKRQWHASLVVRCHHDNQFTDYVRRHGNTPRANASGLVFSPIWLLISLLFSCQLIADISRMSVECQ